jgi:membrane fusion protein, multidrug efflux system
MKNQNWKNRAASSLIILTLASGCQEKPKTPTSGGNTSTPTTAGTPTPTATNAELPGQAKTKVVVMTVGQQNVTIDEKFTAKILAAKQIEVRSRIEGNLNSFQFREGSPVTIGQVLFTIDPRPLQAQVKSAEAAVMTAKAKLDYARSKVNWKTAKAQLAQAEAQLANEQRDVDRYRPLAEQNIIPQQLYDTTVSQRDVAKAQVDAAQANVENTNIQDTASVATSQAQLASAYAALDSAVINLDYTTITSPISGVIGELNVNPGNLVSPGSDVLATISSTDPIYVEFALSESQYLALARRRDNDEPTPVRKFQLILADGEPYPYLGTFSMIDRAVDAATGTIKVRLSFRNPKNLLRPGEFANVKLNKDDVPDAILVPERAVQELQSSKFVYLADADNKVVQREIELGDRYQSSYVVKKGLKTGDRVIIDGIEKVKPGMTVSTEEAK